MAKMRITFEVDKNFLFDMLRKMDGDTNHLGRRMVEQLLMDEASALDAFGMAVYGVTVISRENVSEAA